MNEIAHGERIEDQRIFSALGRAPAEPVAPDEPERIAQEHTQRARRLRALEDGSYRRMVGSDGAVVRRDLRAQPVVPAVRRGHRLRQAPELVGPRRQPVGLAEGVRGHAIARNIGVVRLDLEKKGAAAQQPAILAAPGAGQHDLALRRRQDGREVAAVGGGDGQRIELGRGDDVIGEKAVLHHRARPARRVEAEQPDEAPGRRRERARRHPADRDASVDAVVLPERFQSEVERCGGSLRERPAPDIARVPAQQRLADLTGGLDATGQQVDDGGERRTVVVSVRPVGGAHPVE